MHRVTNCLNCEQDLRGDEKYCPACGQKTDTHRFTWGHFFHEFWHALTHTDKGILNLLKGLALRPGKVVSEYVEGRHKRYFNPITFLLLCLGLFVVMNNLTKAFPATAPDPKVMEQLSPEKRKQYVTMMDRMEVASQFQQKHPNVLALIGFPVEALFVWLAFRRRGRNYVEILIAIIFLGGFANLIFSLLVSPALGAARGTPYYLWLSLAGFVLMAVYSSWGLQGFLVPNKRLAFWKPFLVLILYYIFWSLLAMVFFLWFVFRENTGLMLRKTLEAAARQF
jgi:hypothetical protein